MPADPTQYNAPKAASPHSSPRMIVPARPTRGEAGLFVDEEVFERSDMLASGGLPGKPERQRQWGEQTQDEDVHHCPAKRAAPQVITRVIVTLWDAELHRPQPGAQGAEEHGQPPPIRIWRAETRVGPTTRSGSRPCAAAPGWAGR